MKDTEYLLEMSGISKAFSGTKALNNAMLKIRPGTVHALVGENGAGKSTLMKILLGMYQADEGTIIFKGEKLHHHSPQAALKKGISMIHQELNPVLDMRICDNIFLNREPLRKNGLVDDARMIAETVELFNSLNFEKLNPTTYMRELSIAQTQMVEIAKAVSFNADLIIMDEPTSAISEAEVVVLFSIIDHLRSKDISIIYISHKMDEIFQIADEITVLRDGRHISTDFTCNFDKDRLFALMVARELGNYFHRAEVKIGPEVLRIEGLSLEGTLNNISFSLNQGEILGIAGLVGAGRTEIAEAIFGMHKKAKGAIYIQGKRTNISRVKDAIANGIALASEDRKTYGLFLGLSVRYNTSITVLSKLCNKLSFVQRRKEEAVVDEAILKLNIKTSSKTQLVQNLSGGNQQKIVLAKWMATKPAILILDEPTRGIDVGSKAEIYHIMNQLTKQGTSIIMISSEMPEIVGMSDRVLVIQEGHIAGELRGESITQEHIIHLAAS